MLPSLHSQFVFVGIEPEEDFGSALALDAERERSGPPAGFPPRSYRSAVRYGEQLRRYLDVFGRERIHVIVYDEFRDDTRGAYREACRFLEVDPELRAEPRGRQPEQAGAKPHVSPLRAGARPSGYGRRFTGSPPSR